MSDLLFPTGPLTASLASSCPAGCPAVPLAESALPASHSEESAGRMGIEYSTEDHEDVPLTGRDGIVPIISMVDCFISQLHQHFSASGSPTSLEVLRGSGKYIKKDTVILKLRENGSNYRFVERSG